MRVVFVIGTAGSGKSLFTKSFSEWLRLQRQNVITVNLDPGVITLPYNPEIDIRDSVNLYDLMEEYNLGPNGAMILASDLIADDVESLREDLSVMEPDLVIVDTPGQMELFAFRASGPFLVREIADCEKAIIYLFDSVFSSNPMNYVSNLFLAAAVYSRFLTSQVNLLSKCDLLPRERVDEIVDWSRSPYKIETAIESSLTGDRRILIRDMMKAIYRLGLRFLLIPVSATTNEGMLNVNTALERTLAGGERYTY